MKSLRLDRFLANLGCGSRSEVKQKIRAGKVRVNDLTIKDEASQVDPERDLVIFCGDRVYYQEYIYLMLNKPAGVITATCDDNEPTVIDLIDRRYCHKGIFPVGRLDKDTEGLLLLTNHGELGHQLLSPKKHVPKQYYVKVEGELTVSDQQMFKTGITLEENFITLPAELEIISAGTQSEASVIIYEGKFHQIKRMFQAIGKRVIYLKRVTMGGLTLDPLLNPGEYRELTPAELQSIL